MTNDKPKIHIKKENRGKFTGWAKRHGHKGVTSSAIEEGLASNLASVRKQAQFAKNARSWNK